MSSQRRRFEGTSLEALLDQVREEVGEDAHIVEANRMRRGGLGGFFARETFEVVIDAPGADGPDTEAVELDVEPADPESVESFEPLSLLELAERVSAQERAQAATSDEPSPPPEPSAGFEVVLDRELTAQRWPAADAIAAVDELHETEACAPIPSVRRTRPGAALKRLGLPADLARELATDSPDRELLRLLERLPTADALPTAPGTTVAAVGPLEQALALAATLAGELGVADDTIFLAAPTARCRRIPVERRIGHPSQLRDLRHGWAQRSHPVIVAVECALTPARGFAATFLDAMCPTMTWGAVDAARKPEDVAAWSESLGGVDAIALHGLDDTVSPAAVLQTGIPVGRIDGRRATPFAWGALLTERLAA